MNTESQSWYQDFYQELKRRRVMRVAALYVVLFWPVIQIADILSPALELPAETMQYLLIVFVVGLPVALCLSWLFDLNKTGLERVTPEAGEATSSQALVGRQVERIVIGLLVAVIAVLSYLQYSSTAPKVTDTNSSANPLISSEPVMAVRAIAVLPFATFSDNSEDQFFSDGLTEELLNVLSSLQNLRVTARTSSFAYKGVNKNIQEIGRELKVDTILEGSVRRNDVADTIRVTAQLIEIETGTHLWSQTFDREYRDVFKIQDEIAAAVVGQLKVALGDDEKARLVSREAANPEAMIAASMGRAELAKRTQQSLTDATRYFKRAIDADPTAADPYAGLANAYALLLDYPNESRPLEQAQEAAATALQLDATSAEAWAAQGLIDMQREDRSAAMDAMKKAMSLNPSHAMATMWFGNLQDDEEKRREYHTRAFELDPHSPVAGYNLASDLIRAGREAEAMDVFSKIVEADPYYPLAYELVGQINEFRGRLDEAIHYYKRAYELEARGEVAAQLANLFIDIGDFDNADEWIAEAVAHLPEKNAYDIEWLKISALTARGDQAGANRLMQPMLEPAATATQSNGGYLNTATAGYFLLNHQAIIAAWEKVQSLGSEDTLGRDMPGPNLEANIAAAYAYAQTGQSAESAAVLAELQAWVDGQIAQLVRVNPQLWYVKAQVSAIKGESSLALIHLQRAIDEGWRQHWRPGVEPCFAGLRDLPTFQSMMAGLAARMELMREQLEFESEFTSAAVSS